MAECIECAYLNRPTYKWPYCACRKTNDGRSMFVPTPSASGTMSEIHPLYCPYCTGNSFITTKLDPVNQVEIEVVACKDPYLMVRCFSEERLANWSVGMQIKYCPMCGRRLTHG